MKLNHFLQLMWAGSGIALVLAACNNTISTPPLLAASPTPRLVTSTATLAPPVFQSRPRFQVFILRSLATCLVGNEYASGTVCAGEACGDCDCTWEQHDPPAPQVGVPEERLGEPQYAAYANRKCVDVTLTEQEIGAIKDDMELVQRQVYAWTGGALDLQLEFTILDHVFTGFTAPEFVIGPFEIDDELLNPYVDVDTDFVYVVSGVYDRRQDLRLAYWCGSSYGEYSIHGASYSYIQYNGDVCASIMIAGEQVYEPLIHEWMHNLDWALFFINGVPDPYQYTGPDWEDWDHASWPACGNGSPQPLDWFPSVDFCEWDPDWRDCNNGPASIGCHAGETDGGISWYEHVLANHYPRNLDFVGNFCRDGRQDFGETGTDQGGPCP